MTAASISSGSAQTAMNSSGVTSLARCADPIAPDLADELRARDITVNALTPGFEAPGADHDTAELVALLHQWRHSADLDLRVGPLGNLLKAGTATHRRRATISA
jgi:hypothetical protein